MPTKRIGKKHPDNTPNVPFLLSSLWVSALDPPLPTSVVPAVLERLHGQELTGPRSSAELITDDDATCGPQVIANKARIEIAQ